MMFDRFAIWGWDLLTLAISWTCLGIAAVLMMLRGVDAWLLVLAGGAIAMLAYKLITGPNPPRTRWRTPVSPSEELPNVTGETA